MREVGGNMEIINELNKIKETKTNLKEAIRNRNVPIYDSEPFSAYPEKISQMTIGDGTNNSVGTYMVPFRQATPEQLLNILNAFYTEEISGLEIQKYWHVGDKKVMGIYNSQIQSRNEYYQEEFLSPTNPFSEYNEFEVEIISIQNYYSSGSYLLTLLYRPSFNGNYIDKFGSIILDFGYQYMADWLERTMSNIIFPNINEIVKPVSVDVGDVTSYDEEWGWYDSKYYETRKYYFPYKKFAINNNICTPVREYDPNNLNNGFYYGDTERVEAKYKINKTDRSKMSVTPNTSPYRHTSGIAVMFNI